MRVPCEDGSEAYIGKEKGEYGTSYFPFFLPLPCIACGRRKERHYGGGVMIRQEDIAEEEAGQ